MEETSELRRSDLLRKIAERRSRSNAAPELRALSLDAGLLSLAQERLWLQCKVEGESGRYNVSSVYRLEGEVDACRLEAAWRGVVERHGILRTVFGEDEQGRGVQRVVGRAQGCGELRVEAGAPSEQELRQWCEQGFELTVAPAWRCGIWQERGGAAGPVVVALVLHHLLTDGWSQELLLGEWQRAYEALGAQEPAGAAQRQAQRPALQYLDYAVWQRQRQQQGAYEAALKYWSERLQGVAALALPVEKARGVSAHGGLAGVVEFRLDAPLVQRLQKLAQSQGTTLYVVLLAAYQLLLSRWSGQDDVCVGSSVANRGRAELEQVVGMFVNLLAMRGQLQGPQRFAQLLAQTHTQTVQAFEHQDLPHAELMQRLALGRSGLFQTTLVLQNTQQATQRLRGEPASEANAAATGVRLSAQPLSLPEQALRTQYELMVEWFPTPHGELQGLLTYERELYAPQTVAQWMQRYCALLAAVAEDPQRRLCEYEFRLAGDPQPQAQTQDSHPGWEQGLAQRWREQVRLHGARVAVEHGARSCSYVQLDEAAREVGQRLLARGVRRGTRVGVCLERGLEGVTALLGVVLAGGAYVPLDPQQPAQRLQELIADAGLLHVVSTREVEQRLDAQLLQGLDLVLLDEAPAAWEQRQQPWPQLCGDDLAYLMYTSGSTGKPKGVAVPHRGVARLVVESDYHEADKIRRLGHAATLAFDAATYEVWGALLNGATVVVIDKEQLLEPARLQQALQGLDGLFLTTALFNHCVAQVGDALSGLQTVLFGGEQVDAQAVRDLLQRGGRVRVLHVYGPTENTTFSTWQHVRDVPAQASSVPIGRAVRGSSCCVLDDWLNPVPQGVEGELYVGGAGLAQGYWGQPGLSASRFVPHPWEPGQRLYRTGDLVRWNAQGEIEFVGRRDHQTKLRGYRIELGEVEAGLLKLPEVQGACVQVQAHEGRKQLVAWVQVVQPGVSREAIKRALRQQLPEYMVPTVLVLMDKLPLNANGKIDRTKLPPPSAQDVQAARYEAARDDREAALVQVWEDVLGQDPIGVHDNFFELGGDSLLAIQVKAEAQQRGLQFELALLFEHPTIAELAPQVQEAQAQATELAAFALVSEQDRAQLPEDLQDAYPLSRLQLGMLYHGSLRQGEDIYHELISYRLRLAFDEQALQEALDALVARHAILRTGFELSRYSEPLQCVYRGVQVRVQVHDLRGLPLLEQQARLEAFAQQEQASPLPRERAPLLRVSAHRLDEAEFQFTYSAHHAIWDGWSESLLTTDLLNDYRARLRAEVVVQAPQRAGYRDFIALERQALQDPASQAFWREQLSGHVMQRLADRPAAAQERFEGAHDVAVVLSAQDAQGLQALAHRLGVSIKHVLLAAHLKVLALYSGQQDVVTGLVTNGRPETSEGTALVGLFLNTVPLRMKLGVQSWSELVQQVYAAEQALLPHRRYPLPDIMRLTGGQPLFDVLFNYTHFRAFEASEATSDIVSRTGNVNSSVSLSINFSTEDAGIHGSVSAHRRAFTQSRARAIAAGLAAALHAMALKADTCHATLLPDPSVLQRTLGRNSPHQSVVCRFRDVARREPGRLAARICGTDYSYGALAAQAGALAERLKSLGVRDGVVAICVDRSPQGLAGGLAAQLAVMSVGAAFLSLDPDYPQARLQAMLGDAGVEVLVATRAAQARLGIPVANVLDLAETAQALGSADLSAGWLQEARGKTLAPRIAYVMYTSGSTGRPKGVEVAHAQLARHLDVVTERYGIRSEDRVLQLTSWSFDPSIEQTYAAWWAGAYLCIPPEATPTVPDLMHYVMQERISVANATPSYLRELLAVAPQAFVQWMRTSLRVFVAGGEALSRELVASWLGLAGADGPRLMNAYGPTEATITVSVQDVDALPASAIAPVGQPNAGRSVMILDGSLNPVPVGVVGELYLGGDGLAIGYRGRPVETASAFLPDPHGASGGRMYRTGDMGWADACGQVHYVGRADEQVKLRGFRVELGEIESACMEAGGVREAVARVVMGDTGGTIAVYVVPQDAAFDRHRLLQSLRLALPHQSRPRHLLVLPALPRLANGKLDRKALPDPGPDDAALVPSGTLPQTALQVSMLAIWHDVLRTKQAGIDADFHDLGGNSLLAIRLVSRIREHWRIDMPISVLFDMPTVRLLSDWIAQSTARTLLPVTIPGQPLETERSYPLAPNQAMLWYSERMGHADSAYHLSSHIRMSGNLELDMLAQAVQGLVDRHEVLRTTYADTEAGPRQQVHAVMAADFAVFDHDGTDIDAEALRALVLAEAERPFNLRARGPLRVRAWRLRAAELLLQIVVHHIGCDGWSLDLLGQELMARLQSRNALALPAPSARYVDLACWLEDAGKQRRSRDTDYWHRLLADCGRLPLAAHLEEARHAVTLVLALDRGIDEKLRRCCNVTQATPFAVFAAVTATILSSHFGEHDFVLGTPAANREWAQFEDVVGFFANLLPLRCKVDGHASFAQLVRGLVRSTWDALEHSTVTAQEALAAAQSDGAGAAAPVQVTLTVRDTQTASERDELRAGHGGVDGVDFAFVDLPSGCVPFPLMFDFWQQDGIWRGELRYQSAVVASELAAGLAASLPALLASALEMPEDLLCELQARLAPSLGWIEECRGPRQAAQQGGLDALFRAQVKRRGEALAIGEGGRSLSYAALDGWVQRCAQGLQAQGVEGGELVGLCMPRGIEAIVALVALVRAGAAYVPVDPDMPAARQRETWREAGVRRVVRGVGAAGAAPCEAVQLLEFEALCAEGEGVAAEVRAGREHPQRLAYVMFTSGSSGRPKGVAVPQGAVIRLVREADYLDFDAPMTIGQTSTLAFDASTFEVWGALLNGHALRIVSAQALLSASALAEQIRRDGIDTMWLTAGLFNMLADLDPQCLQGLRTALTGGEAASAPALRRVMQRCPQLRVVNGYGPTENTTFSVTYTLPAPPQTQSGVPIGHPIAGSSARIVDASLGMTPPGAPGELLVGGCGLAWGYWRRADLTAERFIPHPTRAGERLYRTGDQARWTQEGVIEYLGRRDEMVKLRGFRIELGDIESALHGCEGVESACVAVQEVQGRKSLTAYCRLATHGQERDPQWRRAVRRQLRQMLPEYMVPAAFVEIEALPLNANGKVDRQRLPQPGEADLGRAEYVQPSTTMERELARIWASVLGVQRVGVEDNFFELGGDSLKAALIVARVERSYGVDISASTVLVLPTILEMVVILALRRIDAAADDAAIEAIAADLTDEQMAALERLYDEQPSRAEA
jgi:amino acid adenylation domain-containing protein